MLSILLFSIPILSHIIFKKLEKKEDSEFITNFQFFLNKNIGNKCRVSSCIYCKSNNPVTKCPCKGFTPLKSKVTQISYNAKKLRKCDEEGYCAAGILLYFVEPQIESGDNNIKILMIEESRENKIAFNLPGGKRELSAENGILKIESSIETAVFEFIEEVSQCQTTPESELDNLFENYKISTVYWNCQAKYALYPIQIFPNKNNIQTNFINLKDINNINIHPFAKQMLEEVILPLN